MQPCPGFNPDRLHRCCGRGGGRTGPRERRRGVGMAVGGRNTAAERAGLPGGYADSSALTMSGRREEPREARGHPVGVPRAHEDAAPPTGCEQANRSPDAAGGTEELPIRPSGAHQEARGRAQAPADHRRCARGRPRDRARVRRSNRLRGFRRIPQSHGWQHLRFHAPDPGFQGGFVGRDLV